MNSKVMTQDYFLEQAETLIVSAWWPECSELAKLCNAKIEKPLSAGEWVFCPEKKAVVLCCGIGSIAASGAVTRVLMEFKGIKSVVFCGTAGHYKSDVAMNSVFVSRESLFSDAGLVESWSYFPGLNNLAQTLANEFFLQSKDIGIPFVKCLTVPSITKVSELAERFSRLADLEHLEFHGVACAARQFQKNWGGFFGISNTVGPQAHGQWKEYHSSASLAAQSALYAAIFGGG